MAKKSAFKNNVTRVLDKNKIAYTVHQYDYDAGVRSAVEVAEAIGLPPEQVFKTLVAVNDSKPTGKVDKSQKPMLVVVPGPDTLDLKTLAKAVGLKKVRMASHEQAESLTGLQTGGISPIALINKGFNIFMDEQVILFETIAVSAGQRGVNVEVPVEALMTLTGARVISLDA
ncbi:MAG: aminoacyl-tRNA deacylase [Chloroflexota bacterium]